jgi:uncharacterized SAM-binding protein YcdF (DUF218 family)
MRHRQCGGIIFNLMLLIALLLLIGVIYLARYPLLRVAGNFWTIEDTVQHADAIVVLGDDNFGGDRASRAAELFRAGWAPQVVASGRMLRTYMSVADLIARDLESRGVPPSAVVRFAQYAADTREEAEALRQLATDRGWHRLLVVTSNYHTRRARYIFRKVFPPAITVLVVSAPDSDFNPDNWWDSRKSRKIFFLEGVGYCAAMWELRDASREASATVPAKQVSPPSAGH